jgi:hypothetical protein
MLCEYILHNIDPYNGIYHSTDNYKAYTWKHRFNGPAAITIYNNGTKKKEWLLDSVLHRLNGPADITVYDNGDRSEAWFNHDKRHRLDGPAYTMIYHDSIKVEIWYSFSKDDLVYRSDGPNFIRSNINGDILEQWWL